MLIRPLDPLADRALVEGFFVEIDDYVLLERGHPATPELTEEFFADAPPGCDPAKSHRLGLFRAGQLLAIAEMAIGFPEPKDAYIGFLAVVAAARGEGVGRALLRNLEDRARSAGAMQVFLGVLDANPRGRAFWEREGFHLALPNRSVSLGAKTQLAHRLGKAL